MDRPRTDDIEQPIALVVDDEPLIRMDTGDILCDAGFHVVEARTADEAFAFLERHPSLRLVFTDVQMPGDLDGFQLARLVAERWPHVSVIVASGAVRPGPGDLPDQAEFINKPFTPQLVLDTVQRTMGALPAEL
ncbi:response regulator [Aureimonas sp. AU12]|uniref:response regulator n=1 Tax=Aureimonas sp. AU12 TaxID=1638161 RepID=UPI000A5B76AC|nr:response regulator [Aureimonas sp. AU12]